ncbi:helix-turn-helix domain-containing protein [Stenotrophomonas rhizophila]|uniref:helix-turn-helix domain-containing protein n=1 Tax=Stenotrophomonas rhizophila TaxID=216778 RepID=UPI0035182788
MQDETFATQIGSAIRSRRTELGLSQERFADGIAMHRAYYSSIERGRRTSPSQRW